MRNNYRNDVMKELCDQQVRYAPRPKKLEQVTRAERLLSELDTDKNYSYEYICFRITDFRPEASPNVIMQGRDAVHDVRMFVEDLSDSADLPVEEVGQMVWTVEDLSERFNVSTKTISRWREQGLAGRRLIFNGRKRVGFLNSSVKRFVTENPDRIQRGARFSQLSEEERDRIIRQARRLAVAGGCPSEVARRVASTTGRSVETIRYTLKNFDTENPEMALFPGRSGPITEEIKQDISRVYYEGEKIEDICRRFCRTKSTVLRIINEMRARRIMELPLDYIFNECFDDIKMEQHILAPMPENEGESRLPRSPGGLPSYLASLYKVPLLTREQESHLFRKFNFLKYRASTLRDTLNPAHARSSLMDRIERYYRDAVEVKNTIVQSNLRLVVSIAKRHIGINESFFELVSDGNISLIRAAEKFDYSRGNKFSTYASWAIMKNYARTIPDGFKHRDRFQTSSEDMFVAAEDDRQGQYEQEKAQQNREAQVDAILSCLDDREKMIIMRRFGLESGREPRTLKQVGAEMGVTKERVRQIETRALSKLRLAAKEEKIESPD